MSSSSCKIFIPTRDSGLWLGELIQSYNLIDVRPIFIVDARTVDNTIDVLKQTQSEYYEFEPDADYAEAGMIEYGSKMSKSEWALRLDDDEFPSKKLIDSLIDLCVNAKYDAWFISRREIFELNDRFVYSRWPSRNQYFINESQSSGILERLQPFPRLFRTKKVRFLKRVHTAGYETPDNSGFADNDAFFVHFQTLVKSPAERLEKVRKYAAIGGIEDAWSVTDEYLPEYLDKDLFDFSDDGMEEFDRLFNSVKITYSRDLPDLSSVETELMNKLLLRSSLNNARSFRLMAHLLNQKNQTWEDYDRMKLRYIPKVFLPEATKLLSTLSRFLKNEYLEKVSNILWKINSYRASRKN